MTKHHHVIISGTGRAGTTFLMLLLTRLGFDTGFDPTSADQLVDPFSGGGLERAPNTLLAPSPYIIKSPLLCDQLETQLETGHVAIDHAIIPIRQLEAATASRKRVHDAGMSTGGLWGTTDPEKQADVLTRKLYRLIWVLARAGVPVTLLAFPRLAKDCSYLAAQLAPLLAGISQDVFAAEFARTADPSKIHVPG